MYLVSGLVLVMVGALIQGCSGIKCYSCTSEYGLECDDHTFDRRTKIINCATQEFDACWVGKGYAYCKKHLFTCKYFTHRVLYIGILLLVEITTAIICVGLNANS